MRETRLSVFLFKHAPLRNHYSLCYTTTVCVSLHTRHTRPIWSERAQILPLGTSLSLAGRTCGSRWCSTMGCCTPICTRYAPVNLCRLWVSARCLTFVIVGGVRIVCRKAPLYRLSARQTPRLLCVLVLQSYRIFFCRSDACTSSFQNGYVVGLLPPSPSTSTLTSNRLLLFPSLPF